jgi:hypothetical protein
MTVSTKSNQAYNSLYLIYRQYSIAYLFELSKSGSRTTNRVSIKFSLILYSPMINIRIIPVLPLKPTIDISTDKAELNHRLHFHVITEHFTHNNEQIKLHFKVIKRKKNTLFIVFFF